MVTAEVKKAPSFPVEQLISILQYRLDLRHEKKHLGRLIYANNKMFNNYYSINKCSTVYISDQ
jgi:hypothetical protein